MKSVFKPALLAVLLATAGVAAYSQITAADGPMHAGMGQHRMGQKDPARMQAWMDKRASELKAALKLSAAQEGAWATFTAAMKPPTDLRARHEADRIELAKLATPERIDKMKALHAQRAIERTAAMDQRGEATKAFYATLTSEQKKVFDGSTLHYFGGGGRHAGHWGGKGPAQSTL